MKYTHQSSVASLNFKLCIIINYCGFSFSSCICIAGVTMRTGVFGKGSGGMFSVSVSDTGSIVPREEEKCSHDDVAALFCLGVFYIKKIDLFSVLKVHQRALPP